MNLKIVIISYYALGFFSAANSYSLSQPILSSTVFFTFISEIYQFL
jgi:hypothetical protein